MSHPRPVDLARFGLGLAALTRPDAFLQLSQVRDGRWAHNFVRILGARYVVQSGAGVVLDRPWVPQVDAAIDLVHAASMLGVAVVAPTHRKLALLSATAATVFVTADLGEQVR